MHPPSSMSPEHGSESSAQVKDSDEPALKKRKVEFTWNLKAVLDKAITGNIPTVQVFKAQVANIRQTSGLVKKLNEVLPLPSLQHVKRVKSVKNGDQTIIFILLCLAQDYDNELTANIGHHLTDLGVNTDALTGEFTLTNVPVSPPLTRIQFNKLRDNEAYWPCHFHEDKYTESLVNETHELWSTASRERQRVFMERAKVLGGGVVVDPSTNTVIAAGHHSVNLHPLHHGVMNLVDLVARSQGGGASPHTSGVPTFYYKTPLVSQSINNATDPSLQNGRTGSDSKPSSGGVTCDMPSGGVYNLLKRYGSIGQLSEVPKSGPYLCTGYDVYLLREPCAMCAMALVHMRTRRVFYAFPTKDGALGSNDTIHTLEGLNHRYEVFCNILNSDPTAAATEFCY